MNDKFASHLQTLEKKRYWCFISYRHADNDIEQDRGWASWLHQEIERYEVPADLVGTKNKRGDLIPERIYPVFRDEESLSADADLSSSIKDALNQSNYLVVLCSPKAVQSKYVAQEITNFKQTGKRDRIIAAIIAGEPGNPKLECFPVPLRYPVNKNGIIDTSTIQEPIAADFRLNNGSEGFTSAEAYRLHLAKDKNNSLSKQERKNLAEAYESKLQLMKLKIISGILGVKLEQLRDRDKAYQLELARKQGQILRCWLALVSGLALIAIVGGVLALVQRNIAESRARIAESRSMANEAKVNATTHAPRAGLLAIRSSEILTNSDPIIPEPEEVLREVSKNLSGYGLGSSRWGVVDVDITSNPPYAAVAHLHDCTAIWQLQDEKKLPKPINSCLDRNIESLKFVHYQNKTEMFALKEDGSVIIYSGTELSEKEVLLKRGSGTQKMAISPNGDWVAIVTKNRENSYSLILMKRKRDGSWKTIKSPLLISSERISFIHAGPKGKQLVVGKGQKALLISISETETSKTTTLNHEPLGFNTQGYVIDARFNKEGNLLATAGNSAGQLWIWSISNPDSLSVQKISIPAKNLSVVGDMIFSARENALYFSSSGIWRTDLSSPQEIIQANRVSDRAGRSIVISPKNRLLFDSSRSDPAVGATSIDKPRDRSTSKYDGYLMPGLEETNASSFKLKLSENEQWLILGAGGDDGYARIWNLNHVGTVQLAHEIPQTGGSSSSSLTLAATANRWLLHDVDGKLIELAVNQEHSIKELFDRSQWRKQIEDPNPYSSTRVGPAYSILSVNGEYVAILDGGNLTVRSTITNKVIFRRVLTPPEKTYRESWSLGMKIK